MNGYITAEEFSLSMTKMVTGGAAPKIAVAVSGGGDSLALDILMREWVRARCGEMIALTVDHGLRTNSAKEAADVGQMLRGLGINHDILVWTGEKPATHIQEQARNARYKLLLEICRQRGFATLAVAHNLEDQAETFWMRLAHGSGLDGLSSMAPVREVEDVSIIRPVLTFPRERLRATCEHHHLDWIEDPSNQNDKYLRVRLRQFEDLLSEEGLTPARLSQTIQKLEDARQSLQVMAGRAADACIEVHPEGYATLKLQSWKDFPRDIQRRILAQALSTVSAQDYPAGFEAMEQTRQDLLRDGFSGKTLSGCEIIPARTGDVLIVREAKAVEGRVRAAEVRMWDGRFTLSNFLVNSYEVGALGEGGLSELRKNLNDSATLSQRLEALPFKVKLVLPALWQGENLMAVPNIGYYSQGCPGEAQTGIITAVARRTDNK